MYVKFRDTERTVAYQIFVLPVFNEAPKPEDFWGSKYTTPLNLISAVCGNEWSGSCLDF
jgi:hypothetical protein